MESLFENFGVDWRILLIQALNFIIVLAVFTFLIYKPLVKHITERRKKIEEGLMKEKEASLHLSHVLVLEKEKLKQAENKALGIVADAQKRAKTEEAQILKHAEGKGKAVYEKSLMEIKAEKENAIKAAEKEIAVLAREILIKFVKMNPAAVDEALISKLVSGEISKLVSGEISKLVSDEIKEAVEETAKSQ